ncbi:hypothetical protein CEXT_350251 [Caerostris extrusa]|uniref:Uncharacterized protein n=1 Tax=Caerostris extrusa TaxID=172846 RepID=A0AAV4Y0G1_CAEEX|nr:hypothetical protein CEXT_350251 [Caerostris extrusa]
MTFCAHGAAPAFVFTVEALSGVAVAQMRTKKNRTSPAGFSKKIARKELLLDVFLEGGHPPGTSFIPHSLFFFSSELTFGGELSQLHASLASVFRNDRFMCENNGPHVESVSSIRLFAYDINVPVSYSGTQWKEVEIKSPSFPLME